MLNSTDKIIKHKTGLLNLAVNAEVKFPRSAEVIFPTFGIW
jgi:hypothetical protein